MRVGSEDFVSAMCSDFFGLARGQLPVDQAVLNQALISEAIRVSLETVAPDSDGWRMRHVLSIRSWVKNKLRAIIPSLEESSDEDAFQSALKEGPSGSLVFLGDVIELSNGMYAPAPTRAVPVTDSSCLVVSGKPTSLFAQEGLALQLNGSSRYVRTDAATLRHQFGIPVQERASYTGSFEDWGFTEAKLPTVIQTAERKRWEGESDWLCYQCYRESYGFQFADFYDSVASPFGYLSLWKQADDHGANRYWLRIKAHGADDMLWIWPRNYKHTCLLLDKLKGVPRRVAFTRGEGGTIVQTQFPPPASQVRWIHAVGGKWMGSQNHWLRWEVPSEAEASTIAAFGSLPIVIARVPPK